MYNVMLQTQKGPTVHEDNLYGLLMLGLQIRLVCIYCF